MGFTIDTSKPLEQNMGVSADKIPFGTQKVGGRRRSKRGGVFGFSVSSSQEDSDDDGTSTVSDASSMPLSPEEDEMVDATAKATILSAVVKYFKDNKDEIIRGATAAAYATAAAGVLFAADRYYSPEVCSLQWQAAVQAMTLAGVTSAKDKCDLAKNAYDAGMATAMLTAGGLVTAAVQTGAPSIDVSDGVFNGVKAAIKKKLFGSAAAPPAKAKRGGRTKRRGTKKGRKGGKSRKSRR